MYNFLKRTVWLFTKLVFRIEYQGLENIPETGAFIIVGNHKNNFDPILISFTTKRQISYLAKAELFKTRFTKLLFESINCIKIDRNKTDITAIKNALRVLKAGGILGIFPEGTRIKDGSEGGQIKSGAVMIASKGKVDILPVAISGQYKMFAKIKISVMPMYDIKKAMTDHDGDIEEISSEIMSVIYREVDKNSNEN
ncbi:lysophospholipid acyltransferase family protein [Proteocatella sphenisci]|uniref:lysophospholipid acyltransferase family protein n=1 Tax=Proteocatella sphenisci TaxID=181070 RepID=UPI0004911536|nr:lysophospholipid acyltransferase family protein [Proteocatella sphenisci]